MRVGGDYHQFMTVLECVQETHNLRLDSAHASTLKIFSQEEFAKLPLSACRHALEHHNVVVCGENSFFSEQALQGDLFPLPESPEGGDFNALQYLRKNLLVNEDFPRQVFSMSFNFLSTGIRLMATFVDSVDRPRSQDHGAKSKKTHFVRQQPQQEDVDFSNGIISCSLREVVENTLPGVLNALDIRAETYQYPLDLM